MKKAFNVWLIVLLMLLIFNSSLQADFKNSIRKENTEQIMEDDWDYLINPMYFSGLKGKFISTGLDNSWVANAFYAGLGLDLFGLKETLAINYTQNSLERLDNTETDNKTTINNTNYRTVYITKREETKDTRATAPKNLDLQLGVNFPIGDFNAGAGAKLSLVAGDKEYEYTQSGSQTTNGIIDFFDDSIDHKELIKNSDSHIGVIIGGNLKGLRAQAEFLLDSYKGTGSTYEEVTTRQQNPPTTIITSKDEIRYTGDYSTFQSDWKDLDAVPRNGMTFKVMGEMDVNELLQPGILFTMKSYGVNDDEKELKKGVITSTYDANNNGRLLTQITASTTATYDITSGSELVINAYNHSIFKPLNDVLFGCGLGYSLEIDNSEFSIVEKGTLKTLDDNDNNGSFSDPGDQNDIWEYKNKLNDYSSKTTKHIISLPLFVEIGVVKGLALRVGSLLKYTIQNITTTVTTTGYQDSTFTDSITPANNRSGVVTYDKRTDTTNNDTTTFSKLFHFGSGWDISNNISVDLLCTSSTLVNLDAIQIEGTIRF